MADSRQRTSSAMNTVGYSALWMCRITPSRTLSDPSLFPIEGILIKAQTTILLRAVPSHAGSLIVPRASRRYVVGSSLLDSLRRLVPGSFIAPNIYKLNAPTQTAWLVCLAVFLGVAQGYQFIYLCRL